MRVGLVVYGDIESTSGGFLYDRKLAAHLRDRDERVSVRELPWRSYPLVLADNLDPRVGRRLRGNFDVLLEDELCHPSLVAHNRRVDAPVVAVVHHLRSSERWPAWRERVYRAVERRYLESVDAAVYASEATGRAAERLAGPRPSVVARPAGDRFDPDVDDETVAVRADRDPFRVVFVGNLVPRKGLHVLVDGLARLPQECEWRLAVVGASPDAEYARRIRERIRRLGVGDRVRFEGRLPDSELADRFAESHLLAVPSSHEGYGIVYLEGMSFGLPALATTAGGAGELVTHGEDGFLVPPGDAEAVATAVDEVAADRDRLVEMSLAARRRYERHPGWAESMETVRRFLRAVVTGRALPSEVVA